MSSEEDIFECLKGIDKLMEKNNYANATKENRSEDLKLENIIQRDD